MTVLRPIRAVAFLVGLLGALLAVTGLQAQEAGPAPAPPATLEAPRPAPAERSQAATPPAATDPAADTGAERPAAATPGRALDPAGGPGGLHNLSPWSMFLGADIVVKGVMVGLAFASLVTWTVLLAKSLELTLLKRRLGRALSRLSRCRTLGEAEREFPRRRRDLVSCLVGEAADEERLSQDLSPGNGVRERVESRAHEVIRAEGRSARVGMGLLATIGSTSPFVGLFGTVWGIMNSFVGIAKAQTTNLAVVAPGIAEALLATAIGLVAAIPAVIIYNHFARVTKSYLEHAAVASGVVGRLLSRDLDRARAPRPYPRAAAAE